jgi:2TM domain
MSVVINPNSPEYIEAAKKVRRLKDFYITSFVFIVVNLFLYFIDYISSNGFITFAYWVTFGWGIGMFFYGISILAENANWFNGWEERRIYEILAKQQRIDEIKAEFASAHTPNIDVNTEEKDVRDEKEVVGESSLEADLDEVVTIEKAPDSSLKSAKIIKTKK